MDELKQLYCLIRKIWVAATPEEYIRQNTLRYLVECLEFPKASIAVEKDLSALTHSLETFPNRRADILCYSKKLSGELHPLLLIECKAVKITPKELRQIIGYNHFLKASFIALINQTEKKLGWFNSQISDYNFINYIPKYPELTKSLLH